MDGEERTYGMDDENTLMPDPDTLMKQAFREKVEDILHSPFAKTAIAAHSFLKKISELRHTVLDYLVSRTEYDLEYQYEESLGR
ncbi:MAG: hypothetical protein ACP5G0_12170 [Desulfomonilia bacterium]